MKTIYNNKKNMWRINYIKYSIRFVHRISSSDSFYFLELSDDILKLKYSCWLLQRLVQQCIVQNLVPPHATEWRLHPPVPYGLPARSRLHAWAYATTRAPRPQVHHAAHLGGTDTLASGHRLRTWPYQEREPVRFAFVQH